MVTSISRRGLIQTVGGGVVLLALSACGVGVATNDGASDAHGSDPTSDPADTNPFSLVGAFHPSTGLTEPTERGGTEEQVQEGKASLIESESSDDKKVLFVFAKITADSKKNLKVGVINGNLRGGTASAAQLSVDGVNDYGDNYGLNKRGYFSTLSELGYHDGAQGDELMGGSGSEYGVVFLFFVGTNDLDNGSSAHLNWGDYALDFDMASIKEVETPNDMIGNLPNLRG